MNSIHVRRMMANLNNTIKEPAPEPAPEPKAPRRRKPEPEYIERESSDSDSGSESEYEEVNKIKSYFEQEPCEFISPAALGQAKTTKEAVAYLKSKSCPKIPKIKKGAKSIKMDNGPPAPGPETAPAKKRVAKPKAAPVEAPVPAPAAPVAIPEPAPKKVRKVKAPAAPVPAPAAPAPAAPTPAAPAKAKRPASEYAKLVGKYVKEKMSFAEAAKKAKAELDAKKKA